MNLITRCPVCETMFKVAADQFKVAQGWVRCGYCGEVFDAAQHLVAPESGSPAAWAPDAPDALGAPAPMPEPEPEPVSEPVPEPEPAPAPAEPDENAGLTVSDDTPAEPLQPAPATEFLHPDAVQVEIPPVQHFTAQDFSVHDAPAEAVAPEPAPEVSFVRDARRKAFWTRPLVRGFLGLLSLALLVALLLQWVLQQKDSLAAQDPRLAPFLQALCGPLNCEIRPPRRIESLVIDSSSFSKTGPDLYRLNFVLKNTSAAVLEIPALEVTLTDAQEQAVVRRVLAPREFGATAAMLAAHAELVAVVTLKVSGELAAAPAAPTAASPALPLPVTGYRILAFYP